MKVAYLVVIYLTYYFSSNNTAYSIKKYEEHVNNRVLFKLALIVALCVSKMQLTISNGQNNLVTYHLEICL